MSGSTIGGIVGGTIGFFVGSPQLGWMIGSAIGGYLDPDQIEGPRLKDAQVQTSQEGVPRPIVYGTAQVAGNLIQRGPLVERKKKERAGKGGPEQITYHYYMTYAIRVCEGPIAGIRRIWRDDKLVYSLRPGDQIDADSASFASKLTIYLGDETQLPDPSLEALPAENGGGAGNVPSYRGSAYVVFENDDLTERRGTVSQYRFEVVTEGEVVEAQSGSLWIATNGAGLMQRSDGGTDWSTPTFAVPASGHSLMYGGGTLVATGQTDSRHSEDFGETWAACSFSGTTQGQYPALHGAYVGGSFYIVNGRVAISAGGASFGDAAAGGTNGLAVGGRTGLLVSGQNTGVNAGNVNVSTDGFATSMNVVLGGNGRKWQAISSNGTRVGVGSGDGMFQHTEDGTTWSGDITVGGGVAALAAASETWVAVGPHGLHYSTNNGSTWATAELGFAFNGRDVKHHDGLWVACGGINSGSIPKILTSTDGATWTDRSNNFPTGGDSSPVTSIAALGCEGIAAPDAPGFYVTYEGEICGNSLGTITPDNIILSQIVEDLCERVGIPTAKLDTSQLTDEVMGFVVARQMPAAEAIRSLQRGYRFDMPEWDKKLRGIKRGGAIKDTITDADLVGDEEETRAQALEYPRKFNLIVSDPDANYEAVTITSARSPGWVASDNQTTVELPIIFTDADEREQVCHILHKVAWTEMAGRLKIELPEEWTWLTPSDCFNFNDKRWRTERVEILDGSMKVEAVRDRASAYTSNATGVARNPTGPVSSIRGPTLLRVMNLPSLRTQDNQPGVYVAVTGLLPAWDGCTLELSVDGGATFQSVATIISRATMGELTAPITSSTEPVPVYVYDHRELDSITSTQLDAGFNAFAIGTSDVWEVGQFQTATEGDPNRWELTDVLRGQEGTTAAAHATGAPFVLIDEAVPFIPIAQKHAGETLIFRAVTFGTAPALAEQVSVVFDPPVFVIDGGEVT